MVSLEVRGHLARRRLKRNDVADILGVSLRTVSDLLGERRPWRVDEVEIITAWLDVDIADLLFPKRAGYGGRRDRTAKRHPADAAPFDFGTAEFEFEPSGDAFEDSGKRTKSERRGRTN